MRLRLRAGTTTRSHRVEGRRKQICNSPENRALMSREITSMRQCRMCVVMCATGTATVFLFEMSGVKSLSENLVFWQVAAELV